MKGERRPKKVNEQCWCFVLNNHHKISLSQMVLEKPKSKMFWVADYGSYISKLRTECSKFGVHSSFVNTPNANNFRSKLQNILHFTNEILGKYKNVIAHQILKDSLIWLLLNRTAKYCHNNSQKNINKWTNFVLNQSYSYIKFML